MPTMPTAMVRTEEEEGGKGRRKRKGTDLPLLASAAWGEAEREQLGERWRAQPGIGSRHRHPPQALAPLPRWHHRYEWGPRVRVWGPGDISARARRQGGALGTGTGMLVRP